MRFLSVCSGIEAATVAWSPLGWTPVAYSEIEAFPSAVLDYHHPNTPNRGDMERFHEWPDADVDVLVGGTPCQSFSVAGLRRGLDDPRGNLALVYLAIAERYRPEWLVWENVPGVLSANGGRAFGAFLGGLEKLGYGWAYRTLDAQYFGLAQRRRRVFVVASARGWGAAGSVLFEPESLRGDSAPGREAGERVAATLTRGAESSGRGGYAGRRQEDDSNIVTSHEVAQPLLAKSNCSMRADAESYVDHALTGEGFDASEDGTGRGTPLVPQTAQCLNAGAMGRQDAETETLLPHAFDARQNEVCQYGNIAGLMDTDGRSQAVAFTESQSGVREGGPHATLDANKGTRRMEGVREGMSVRRLTPRECERLQGFPDDFTLIPTDKARRVEADWLAYIQRTYPSMTEEEAMRMAKDGPRYKALGNSMAVPVVRWIGERIAAFESEVTA